MKQTKSKNLKSSFTLIELLVVVAIIGVIVAILIPNISQARIKARDARRAADIKAYQTALELYYSDQQHYPIWYEDDGSGNYVGGAVSDNTTSNPLLSPDFTKYLKGTPDDPLASKGKHYYYQTSDGNGTDYILVAGMEREADVPDNDMNNPDLDPDDYPEYATYYDISSRLFSEGSLLASYISSVVSGGGGGEEQKSITVTAPNGGEQWTQGEQQNITWSYTGDITNVKLEYSDDNGSSWSTIESSISADSSPYSWTVPSVVSDQMLVKASDASDSNYFDISDSTFAVSASIKRVFVTSGTSGSHGGNLLAWAQDISANNWPENPFSGTNGFEAGDYICNYHANKLASLGGNWKAWLSSSESWNSYNPYKAWLVIDTSVKYYLVDGTTLVHDGTGDSICDGLSHAINMTEHAQTCSADPACTLDGGGYIDVITGTMYRNYTCDDSDYSACDDYTSTAGNIEYGRGSYTDENWHYNQSGDCSWGYSGYYHLYCFEQ